MFPANLLGYLPQEAVMVRRLCILCFLVALWPGLASAQSAALTEARNRAKALYQQGLYEEAERYVREAGRGHRHRAARAFPNPETPASR